MHEKHLQSTKRGPTVAIRQATTNQNRMHEGYATTFEHLTTYTAQSISIGSSFEPSTPESAFSSPFGCELISLSLSSTSSTHA